MSTAAYILIFIILLVGEVLYLRFARKAGIVAIPDVRSSHSRSTVVGGGVVFYMAVVAFFVASGGAYPWLFGGASLLAVVSFADDLRPLGVGLRMAVQFVAVAMMCLGLNGLGVLPWWIICLGVICAVGFVNAWNFMDGINGLNGMYTILALSTLIYINNRVPFIDPAFLVVALMAADIFTYCNFRRRPLCFAGDVGSVMSAIVVLYPLAVLIVTTDSLMWLGLAAVYGVDAVLTIIRRIMLGQNIFKAHRMHLYQLLANEARFGHLWVASAYVVVQLIINMGLMMWKGNPYVYLAAVLLVLVTAYILLVRSYGIKKQTPEPRDPGAV